MITNRHNPFAAAAIFLLTAFLFFPFAALASSFPEALPEWSQAIIAAETEGESQPIDEALRQDMQSATIELLSKHTITAYEPTEITNMVFHGSPDNAACALSFQHTGAALNFAAHIRPDDRRPLFLTATGLEARPEADFDGDGLEDTYAAATLANISNVFSQLAAILTTNDQLVVFTTDHGSQASGSQVYINLWNMEELHDYDLKAMTTNLPCPIMFIMEQCHSGGFIDDLNQSNRVIATAAPFDDVSWAGDTMPYYDQYVYYWTAAVRGYFPGSDTMPWVDGEVCAGADVNFDGYVSFKEASDYAYSNRWYYSEEYQDRPQYSESPTNFGNMVFMAHLGTNQPLPRGSIGLNVTSLTFAANYAGPNPAPGAFSMWSANPIDFSYSSDTTYSPGGTGWLNIQPAAGAIVSGTTQQVAMTANAGGLDAGLYIATNILTSTNALNSPKAIIVTLTVNKADQSISFPAIDDQDVRASVSLSATASSGLEVVFTASPPGVISRGSILTFTGTGSVNVVAGQAGDNNWNAAPAVTNTIQVTGWLPGHGGLAINLNREDGEWSLSGPDDYTGAVNGTGSLALAAAPTGSYTVSFGYMPGFRRPATRTMDVKDNETTTFTGEYIVGQTQSDFGGEGFSDLAVYDPLTGRWYVWSPTSGVIAWDAAFGGPGFEPVPGDYDGDGRADFAVYYNGYWYAQALDGTPIINGEAFGGAEFSPVTGDYDGDGITDLTVYHEATGYWYSRTVAGLLLIWGRQWGGPGFKPAAGDYNKSGRTDLAVYMDGYWHIMTAEGEEILLAGLSWGGDEFTPVPGDYDGDGTTDLAVYHEASGSWFILGVDGTLLLWGERWGGPGFTAVSGDYNGDGIADLVVYNDGLWFARGMDGAIIFYGENWGADGLQPAGR